MYCLINYVPVKNTKLSQGAFNICSVVNKNTHEKNIYILYSVENNTALIMTTVKNLQFWLISLILFYFLKGNKCHFKAVANPKDLTPILITVIYIVICENGNASCHFSELSLTH